MPRVKVDYIVSVSSEDPDNQANNLLAGEVNKKKWLCTKGEQSCSVVLQLARAVMISAVHIGAHHAAFVEVLVGSSEKPNDQYEVLVPSCTFASLLESRRDEPVQRVRSFNSDQLTDVTRRCRWDRVRVLCLQPYNKHCQFGLSFIHIYEDVSTEPSAGPQPIAPALTTPGLKDKLISLGTYSSDDDDFRPGELFAKHRQSLTQPNPNAHNLNTDAQIRQASSQAIRNISDTDTKLKKTPITKTNSKRNNNGDSNVTINRGRENLVYTPDDEGPHAKIDRVVMRHKEQKEKSDEAHKDKNSNANIKKDKVETVSNIKQNKNDSSTRHNTSSKIDPKASGSRSPKNKDDKRIPTRSQQKDTGKENRKRHRSDDNENDGTGPVCEDERDILSGVVFAMSGFVNPERAALRDAGLALGAGYRPDWTSDCTHLICAFPNTPKMKTVVASAPHAYVVSGAWLRECRVRRRRLPEKQYSLHPRAPQTRRTTQPSPSHSQTGPRTPQSKPLHRTPRRPPAPSSDQEGDTDDEIERVVREHNKRARMSSPGDDDVAFVCDERVKGSVTLLDSDEDATEDERAEEEDDIGSNNVLPDFLDGKTFLIKDDVRDGAFDVQLLERYVRAYGGLLLQESHLDEGAAVDYILSTGTADDKGHVRGTRLRPDWLWRCHETRALCPTQQYTLSC